MILKKNQVFNCHKLANTASYTLDEPIITRQEQSEEPEEQSGIQLSLIGKDCCILDLILPSPIRKRKRSKRVQIMTSSESESGTFSTFHYAHKFNFLIIDHEQLLESFRLLW